MIEIEQRDYRDTLARAAEHGGADLVVTSPPYDDARTYGAGVSWTMADYRALGDALLVGLRPGGHALVVLSGPVRDTPRGTERSLTPWRVVLDWTDRVGLRCPDVLAYARAGMPGEFRGRFRQDWEPILWMQRPGVGGWMEKSTLRESARFGRTRASSCGIRRQDGSLLRRVRSGRAVDEGTIERGTLWSYGMVGHGGERGDLEATDHPARFASRFARDAVRCFCPPGGLVCDPFVGSGTSAVVAVEEGRRFVGGDTGHDARGVPWASVALDLATAQPPLLVSL